MQMKNKIQEKVTANIISKLEDGELARKKSRNTLQYSGGSGKLYSGMNQLNLMITAGENGFGSPLRVTYNNAKNLGGSIKKGEKGTPCIYFKMLEKEDKQGETKKIPMMKVYYLFNLDQTTVVPEKVEGHDLIKARNAESIVENFEDKPLVVRHPQPHYAPKLDQVGVPNINQFDTEEAYYSTLFHEFGHSLMNPKRMDLPVFNSDHKFGSTEYALEELDVQLCSAFLTAHAGIANEATQEQDVAYLVSWLKHSKDKEKVIMQASKNGWKRAEYILGEKV